MKKVSHRVCIIIFVILLTASAGICIIHYACASKLKISVINKGKVGTYKVSEMKRLIGNGIFKGMCTIYTSDGDIDKVNGIDSVKAGILGGIYLKSKGKTFKNPVGVLEDNYDGCITDVYDKAMEYSSRNEKVLIIYVDGLGYARYKTFLEKNVIPNIKSLGPAEKAITVFPPITDVSYTSMVTGKTPRFTGIKKRSDSILLSQTIFQNAEKKGKSAIIIEAGIKILHDDSKTILNTDENNDGSSDDEIFNCALKKIKGNSDIILVHFHSVDDAGHKYGPDSKQAQDRVKLLDSYIGELIRQWKGRIILTADHGMHSEENYGEHGMFMPEDLFIPIIYSQK